MNSHLGSLEIGEIVRLLQDSVLKDGQREDLWAEIFRRYGRWIVSCCLGRLSPRQDAEDAAQETFVKALENLKDLRDPDRFEPWLHSICRNNCKKLLRKRQTRAKIIKQVATDRAPSGNPQQGRDTRAAWMDLARQAPLSDEERAIIVRTQVIGHSVPEVARQMGDPYKVVKSLYDKAMLKVKKFGRDQLKPPPEI